MTEKILLIIPMLYIYTYLNRLNIIKILFYFYS